MFEERGWSRDEVVEEVGAVAVDAEVAVGGKLGDGVTAVGDLPAGEVKGVALVVEDDFNDVGVGEEGWVIDGARGGDHGEGLVFAKGAGEGVDERGVEEGFVTLNVDDVGGGLALRGGFGDAVGAGGMISASANGASAYGVADFGDAVIVGGDDEFIDFLTERSTFEDVLEEGFAEEGMEGLSGEASRGPAGRDDPNDACFFVVNINPP